MLNIIDDSIDASSCVHPRRKRTFSAFSDIKSYYTNVLNVIFFVNTDSGLLLLCLMRQNFANFVAARIRCSENLEI